MKREAVRCPTGGSERARAQARILIIQHIPYFCIDLHDFSFSSAEGEALVVPSLGDLFSLPPSLFLPRTHGVRSSFCGSSWLPLSLSAVCGLEQYGRQVVAEGKVGRGLHEVMVWLWEGPAAEGIEHS